MIWFSKSCPFLYSILKIKHSPVIHDLIRDVWIVYTDLLPGTQGDFKLYQAWNFRMQR